VSEARFVDGLRYRIEIPSVEGPVVLRAVLAEAEARRVPVRRVSQGSGVMMLTDAEIVEVAKLGAEHGIEVSLFLGPRGAWDTGGQSSATGSVGGVARGQAGVDWCIAEVRRAVRLGIRSVLVADLGVLATLGRMKRDGSFRRRSCSRHRSSFRAPIRQQREPSRSSARRRSTSRRTSCRRRGPSCGRRAPSRSTSTSRPDDQGGFVRFYEVPDLIRAASPVYLKLGIRNAPNIYPAGLHLEDVAARLARERVPARSSCSGSSASWHPSCSRSAEPTGQPTSASPSPDTRVAEVLVSPL
jgi:hypothetical protein